MIGHQAITVLGLVATQVSQWSKRPDRAAQESASKPDGVRCGVGRRLARISRRAAVIEAGPLAASPFLRTLPASAAAVPASVPELFPSVTRFELDRANVVLITISEAAGLASAKLDFRDAAGQSIQPVTFRAAQ